MTAAVAAATANAAAIPPDKARSLNRWNLGLSGLHFVQFAAMMALSLGVTKVVTTPISSSYLSFDAVNRTLVPAERVLFDLPIGPSSPIFFLLSAIAHLVVALPARGWYERSPRDRPEPGPLGRIRALVVGDDRRDRHPGRDPRSRHAGRHLRRNAAMNLFGWSMEAANQGRERPQWLHYIFGCIAGAVPWIVIFTALITAATVPDAAAIPGFVIAIFISLFISFNVFAINMVLQYKKVGRWATTSSANAPT